MRLKARPTVPTGMPTGRAPLEAERDSAGFTRPDTRPPERRDQLSSLPDRLRLVRRPAAGDTDGFAAAVRDGLGGSPKSLPCRFLYDAEGSRIFEEICRLPEYYPTRTEGAILARSAREIADAVGPNAALAELGSGSSGKTRLLIEAFLARQATLHYAPVDISAGFLEKSAARLVDLYPGLLVTAIAAEYRDAIPHLPTHAGPRLVLFLGSNVGNLEESEASSLLASVAERLLPSDRLLVGFDRLKSPALLERAYDDAAGVTARFNRNLLARANRELGAEFDLHEFAHAAPFVAERSRVEMRLVSRRRQEVRIAALGRTFAFEEGETIHTESCHKYGLADIGRIAGAAGLRVDRLWSDPLEWFSLALLAPEGRPGDGGDGHG